MPCVLALTPDRGPEVQCLVMLGVQGDNSFPHLALLLPGAGIFSWHPRGRGKCCEEGMQCCRGQGPHEVDVQRQRQHGDRHLAAFVRLWNCPGTASAPPTARCGQAQPGLGDPLRCSRSKPLGWPTVEPDRQIQWAEVQRLNIQLNKNPPKKKGGEQVT